MPKRLPGALFLSAILQYGRHPRAADSASQGDQTEKGGELDRSLGGLGGESSASQTQQEEGQPFGLGTSLQGWAHKPEVFDAQLEGDLAFA